MTLDIRIAGDKMKNLIILILTICLIFSILVSIKIYNLDLACRKYEGWTFYSLIPVPTCHADLDIAPFSDMRQSAYGYEVIY